MEVLVVCVGNLCRSPLAERLLAARAAAAGLALSVGSAGTSAVVGSAMEPAAAAELVRLGGDPAGFAARALTGDLAGGADLVLAATREVRTQVVQAAPRAMRRTFTLLELAALCAEEDVPGGPDLLPAAARLRGRVGARDLDLVDPMGRGERVHREVADRIAEAVDTIVAGLA